MKTKLTVSVDRDLLPRAKRSAQRRGVSLSAVIEQALTRLADGDQPSFAETWKGRFAARVDVDRDPRTRELARKYLGPPRP